MFELLIFSISQILLAMLCPRSKTLLSHYFSYDVVGLQFIMVAPAIFTW